MGTKGKNKQKKAPVIGSTSIPKSAFRSHIAGEAADHSLKTIAAGVLAHAGFEGMLQSVFEMTFQICLHLSFLIRLGTSTLALDIITHVTAEYMMNLGRTIKFYADRQGDKMSSEVGLPKPLALLDFEFSPAACDRISYCML